MANVHVLDAAGVGRIEAVAKELFADCGPRLTADDRARLAAVLRDVLKLAVTVDEADVCSCLSVGSEDKCKACGSKATHVAYARAYGNQPGGLGKFCEAHAEQAVEHDSPEYRVDCPNCGCLFGVN